jgi:hypothetical protein
MIMKKALLLSTVLGLMILPLSISRAASIDEIIHQLNTYKASGEIRDSDLASSLLLILSDAKREQTAGDTASKNNLLESFKDTVSANSGDLITSTAASKLLGMTP